MNPDSSLTSIKLTAYFCYMMAAGMLFGIYLAPAISTKVIALVMSAFWYQAGSGLLRLQGGSRLLTIVLLLLTFLTSSLSIYGTIIIPAIDKNIVGSGYARWISVFFWVVSLAALTNLFRKDVRELFRTLASEAKEQHDFK